MSCGDHLAWGYVDQPPLIPFLIHICRAVLGDSLRSIRFIPALASSSSGCANRRPSPRIRRTPLRPAAQRDLPSSLRRSIFRTAACSAPTALNPISGWAAPISPSSPSSGIIPAVLAGFGVVAGIGMEEKYSIAVFGFGIVVGLLLTAQRRVFLNQWIWLGGLAAFLIFLPNLLWNIALSLAVRRVDAQHSRRGPRRRSSTPQFFLQQTLLIDPITAPIWLAGLFALLFSVRLKPYRLAWLVLPGLLHRFLHSPRKELLPRSGISHAAGGGGGSDRIGHRWKNNRLSQRTPARGACG